MMILYLIDFSNLFLTYFSIFKTSKNLIPNIIQYIYNLTKFKDFQYFVFISEISSSKYRYEKYPDYKRNRKKIDDEVYEVLRSFKKSLINYLKEIGINLLYIEDVEADDLIGYFVNMYYENKLQIDSVDFKKITIISNDNDFIQLIKPHKKLPVNLITKYYIYGLNNESDAIYLGQKKLKNPRAFLPTGDSYLLYKVLQGDLSDNIKPSVSWGRKLLFNQIFNVSNKNSLLNLEINDFDDILNFLKRFDLPKSFDPIKAKMNYELMTLNDSKILNQIVKKDLVGKLKNYIVSGKFLRENLTKKRFLLTI